MFITMNTDCFVLPVLVSMSLHMVFETEIAYSYPPYVSISDWLIPVHNVDIALGVPRLLVIHSKQ